MFSLYILYFWVKYSKTQTVLNPIIQQFKESEMKTGKCWWMRLQERKKMEKINKQWVYTATARSNNTAGNTVVLKEALKFSFIMIRCVTLRQEQKLEEMMVYSPVQPSIHLSNHLTWPKSKRAVLIFFHWLFLNV